MFSARLPWDLKPNRLAQLVEAKRLAGRTFLDLTEANPTRAGLSYPAEAILGSLAGERSLVYEPSAAGSRAAREAVCRYYAARGCPVEPERVLLTASTSEAYAYLFKLLADPGDTVLAPRPSYPLFEFLGAMESVRIVQYPMHYQGEWAIDLDALKNAVTGRTRAIVLVHPNNPTGSFVKRGEAGELVKLCRDRHLALISDEVFGDYGFLPDARRIPTVAEIDAAPAFAISGLSKVAGLPQMKLGWIVAGGPAAWRAEAMEKLELIADTYLSVGTPVQNAASRLLEAGERVREQIRRRTSGNLDVLRRAVGNDSPFRVLQVEGGWYATLQAPRIRTEEEWALALLGEDDVLVQPGYFFDFDSEAFLVVSLLTRPEVFREGIERLLARV